MKLEWKQDLNVIHQVCVFSGRFGKKLDGRPGLLFEPPPPCNNSPKLLFLQWPSDSVCLLKNYNNSHNFWTVRDRVAETFSTSPLNGIKQNLPGSKIKTSSTKFVFFGRSEKQDGRPGLWLAETFSTSPLKSLKRNSNETWQKARCQRPLPSLCFSGRSEKQDDRHGLWLAETFSDFSSKTAEQNWMKLEWMQDGNVLNQYCIFGPISKQNWWQIVLRCTICGPLGLLSK